MIRNYFSEVEKKLEGITWLIKKLKLKAKYTTKELCSKGEKIYAELKEKLEPTLNNKFVAIH